jgi:hypothetical protein
VNDRYGVIAHAEEARMRRIFLLFAMLLSQALCAQPVAVPAPLEPWRGWALDGQEFRDCGLIAGNQGVAAQDFVCAWPGVLQVQAGADGAQFTMSWQVQAESWVALPGNHEFWPQDVRVNGQAMPVLEHDGIPQLRLKPGNYSMSGRIGWAHRPQSISVPISIGLVRLQVDGQAIAPVQFEGGELVLGRGASEAPEADALELRVYRRLQDDVPMLLETLIQVRASGQAREEVIGPVLPPGFAPTSIEVDAGWPARIEADGRLRIQVQPDIAQIRVLARAIKPMLAAAIGKTAKPWPEQEIWSYAGNPEQRVSSASGPPQVDPEQAQVPANWRGFPAFALSPGASLNIEVRSRGLGSNETNRLQLGREAWLDFSGGGWTLRDGIVGVVRQGWRFDAQPPYKLEDARDQVAGQALLVTQGEDHLTGVEWRTPQVNLSAGLRVQPATFSLPVSGWQQTFDSVNMTLHLPHGYRLIAAPGADVDDGSWVSAWTLLDIFLVAIVVLFAWRALGLAGGAIALGYLLVDYHENDAPLYSLGILLALVLLLRALPAGRLQRVGDWARKGALLVLALLIVPFAAAQLRMAIYPQLENSSEQAVYPMQAEVPPPPAPPPPTEELNTEAMSAPAPAAAAADQAAEGGEAGRPDDENLKKANGEVGEFKDKLDSVVVTGARFASPVVRPEMMERYSQTTIVQAGRGLPNWRGGQSYQLSWSGPVTAEQSMRLLISPPWLTRSLRVLAVLALAWLLLRLGRIGLPKIPSPKTNSPAFASLLVMCLLAAAHPGAARAQSLPNNETLQELHNRLTRAPKCAPDCAAIATARVDVKESQLQVTLDVHAETRVGVPVPMDVKSLSLDSVQVDGAAVPGVARSGPGFTLPLERGVHRVQLGYRISGDRVALAFPMTPHAIEFFGDGWQATGITDARLLTETLGLNRVRVQAGTHDSAAPAQEFPPYVRVERTLTFGLDWGVGTQVLRMAPKEGGFSVKLPVIAGEKVITPGLLVRKGILEIPMPDGDDSTSWNSTLDKSAAVSLHAPDLADHAEVWHVRVSPLWRAQFSGVPESVSQLNGAGNEWHEFVFHPLPGETLQIVVTRPAPVAGSTQAIEKVALQSSVGQRASEYTLTFQLRASQGGERVLGLPDKAELLAVTRNGESLNLRLQDGKLSLPVQPGEQNYQVRFRDDSTVGLHNRTPAITLGLPAANIDLGLNLPDNRWVIATHGPQSGPAVLYWGELLVLLLVAYGLSKLAWTPLRLRDWLLLGIGFSTFSWVALAIVVAWLFALAWRERHGSAIASTWRFDALQVFLIALSVAAALALVTAIPYGLLGRPDMHIVNPIGGAGALSWFADQSDNALPQAGAFSLPMWLYRAAMLAWALWLANAVLGWLRWGLRAWIQGGYWRARKPSVAASAPAED